LAKLCLMLASGEVRYDPETGKRLATYLFSGWPEYFTPEEFLLEVPSCFKEGEIVGMGTYWHRFKAVGCTFNFHPWTGRRLGAAENRAFKTAFLVSAGGEAGPSPSAESQIRERQMTRPSSASLGDIKNGLVQGRQSGQ
jgi:hypothetical protein